MSNRLYGPSGAPGTAGSLALNTSGAASGVLPALQTVTTSSETAILNPALNSSTALLVLNIPPGGQLEQRKFKLLASGYVTAGTTGNVTIKPYPVAAPVLGTTTALGSTGAVSVTGSCPWSIELNMVYDSVSGKMQGTFRSFLNNTLVAEVAIATTSIPAGISNTALPVASFTLSVTFGTANAGNKINVQEFAIYEN